jgi:hypothetical protein
VPPNNIDPLTRVLTNSKITDKGCWEYLGSHNGKGGGYCQFSVKNKHLYVHRFMYEYYYNSLDSSLVIDHLCRNSRCVNPLHLEETTQKTNCRRGLVGINMSSKTHCPKGHPYNLENTHYIKNSNGNLARQCKTCNRINQKNYQERKKNRGN